MPAFIPGLSLVSVLCLAAGPDAAPPTDPVAPNLRTVDPWDVAREPQAETPKQRRKRKRLERREARKKHPFREHRFLPVPVLRTEPGAGFTSGVRGRYVYRKADDRLNRVQLDLVGRVSVKLVQEYELRLRMRDLLGKNEIVDLNFRTNIDPVFTYVGIANHADLTNKQIVGDPFEAQRLSIAPDLNYQFVLKGFDPDQWFGKTPAFLRGFVGGNFAYDLLEAAPGSLLAMERPDDLGEDTRGTYYLGLAWDSRDNDWNPKAGGFHDISVAAGGPWAGGSQTWGRLNASFRHYQAIGTPKLVLANEILAEYMFGDVPLISKGEFSGLVFRDGVGGLHTGRGYFRRRFIGDRKLYTSAEVRIEPHRFKIGRFSLAPGLKPFIDLAWVEDGPTTSGQSIHVSGGIGVYAVWDDFEVLRFDAGFSPEGFALVMSADHAF